MTPEEFKRFEDLINNLYECDEKGIWDTEHNFINSCLEEIKKNYVLKHKKKHERRNKNQELT